MAKEIKSVNAAPRDEENTINLWQSFGWELKNNQEVKTQDVQVFTGQDSDGTKHYETTRGEHYVKLTFERDPARQNYAELVVLEKLYYSEYNSTPPVAPEPEPKPGRLGCLPFILLVGGFLGGGILGQFIRGSEDSLLGVVVTYLFTFTGPLLGIVFGIKRVRSYPERRKAWAEKQAAYAEKQAAYEEARAAFASGRDDFEKKRAEALQRAISLV